MWSQFAMQASTCCIPRNQEHISYRSPVLLKFSNFRYHGNRGRSETNFAYTVKFANPENPDWCKNQEHISHRSPVIANFLLKFSNLRCHGNRGWCETNFTYTVKFADSENPLIGARIRNISPIEAQL